MFRFQFFGHPDDLQRIATGDGGFVLRGAEAGWDPDEGLRQGISYALEVWYRLRMLGETEWEQPELLLKWLKERHFGHRQIFQWIGLDSLGRLAGIDPRAGEKEPLVQLSLAVEEGLISKVWHAFQTHPLFAETGEWMRLQRWGRGSGFVAKADPFGLGADPEVFFLLVRDMARQVPLQVDRMGFRSVRAWLPLEACRSLLRQMSVGTP